MEADMFPTVHDIRSHRSSATRLAKQKAVIERKASEIHTPDDLCDYLLEIAGARYRRGDRVAKFTVEVPLENFVDWAQASSVASASMDQFDKSAIRQSLTRLVKKLIRTRIRPNVIFSFEGVASYKDCILFRVQFTILSPRT